MPETDVREKAEAPQLDPAPEPKPIKEGTGITEPKFKHVEFVDGEKHKHIVPKVDFTDVAALTARAEKALATQLAELSTDDDDTSEDDLDLVLEVIVVIVEGGKPTAAQIAALKAAATRTKTRKTRRANRGKALGKAEPGKSR